MEDDPAPEPEDPAQNRHRPIEDGDNKAMASPDMALPGVSSLNATVPGTERAVLTTLRVFELINVDHPQDVRLLIIRSEQVTDSLDAAEGLSCSLQEAAVDALSEAILDPAWTAVTGAWVTPAGTGIACFAEGIQNSQDAVHDAVIGLPIRAIGSASSLDPTLIGGIVLVGTKLSLPGDGAFKVTKLTTLVVGIVIAGAIGAPLLLNACTKILAHDVVSEAFNQLVGRVVDDLVPTKKYQPSAGLEGAVIPDRAPDRSLLPSPWDYFGPAVSGRTIVSTAVDVEDEIPLARTAEELYGPEVPRSSPEAERPRAHYGPGIGF